MQLDEHNKRFIFQEFTRILCFGVVSLIVGAFLNYFVQSKMLSQDQDFEIYKEKVSLLKEIVSTASERRWKMQRVIWVIKGTAEGDIEESWKEYYKSVELWNVQLVAYAARMKLYGCDRGWIEKLIGDNEGGDVIYEGKKPESMHGYLLRSHERMKALYKCEKNGCPSEGKKFRINDVEKAYHELGQGIYDFVDISAKKLEIL